MNFVHVLVVGLRKVSGIPGVHVKICIVLNLTFSLFIFSLFCTAMTASWSDSLFLLKLQLNPFKHALKGIVVTSGFT